MSKQITPSHYGWTRAEPTRGVILLRAWALWRARSRGWSELKRGRARHFEEHELLLERDIRALEAPCQMLGNPKANALLREWAPAVVARLRPQG